MKPITEFLSTKVAKPSIIKATNKNIRRIVKDELDLLGHDCDLNHIDVSEVTDMYSLFSCDDTDLGPKYKDLNPNISMWDVSQVVDMQYMFLGCENFNQDLSQWDVGKVKNMWGMFCECENFNQDLSKWDVKNVENMVAMFERCENFNQDLSSWDVSNVGRHHFMFNNCHIKEEFKPKFNI